MGYHSVHLRFRFRARAQKLACRYCSLLGAFAVFLLSLGGVVFSGRSVRIPFGFVRHGADATRVLWRLFPFFGGPVDSIEPVDSILKKGLILGTKIVCRSVQCKKKEENKQKNTFCTGILRQENAPESIETAKNRRSLYCARSF